MCNDPLPKSYLDKMMLPLHAIFMAFSDNVEGKHHQCIVDSL